ncbi:MAG: nicotinate phosphoribosyltransferase [Methylobacter sp.]
MSNQVLFTDLYQLTMLQSYFEERMEDIAVFELFVRKLPPNRNFLLAAGLQQALEFLEQLRLTTEELDWLAASGMFKSDFLERLAALRFTGDVHAMPEGTVFFADEPILRITAPFPEAQLVESRIINLLHFQTLIASKAARSVLVAPDKVLVDFGMRRAHGDEAGLLAARASYLAGFAGSSTVSAGQYFGIPLYGTMAHSFIQAHRDESEAFEQFALANPDNVVFLIDTYNTEAGAQKVVELAPLLRARGIDIKGVRLDSGDLGEHARQVRNILDKGGLAKTTIFASGDIDEYKLEQLLSQHAPIDGFGIGTRMDTSADAPYLNCAYKLQEYAGLARRKRSEGKATWPGRKQIYRHYDAEGFMSTDTLTLADSACEGQPLLEAVMKNGRTLTPYPSLETLKKCARKQLNSLPPALRGLGDAPVYPVQIANELVDLAKAVDALNK